MASRDPVSLALQGNFTWRFSYGDDSHVGDHRLSREASIGLLLLSCAAYLVITTLSKNEKLFGGILKINYVHNVSLSAFSGIVFWWCLSTMLREDHFRSFRAATCEPIENSTFEYVSGVFLLSKIWEWVDSVILIKKGKKLRFLHWFHHMTTFWLYAIDHTFKSSIKYGVMVNAFIHFLMYAHYAQPFPPFFRRLITQLQILQFILSVVLHSMIYVYDCDAHLKTHFWEFITPYFLIIPFLILFSNFYIKQYIVASGRKKSD